MKSGGVIISTFFEFAFLVVTLRASSISMKPTHDMSDTWSVEYNATGRALQLDNRCILHMDDIYRVNYCTNRACPSWKCEDDSAIIHGTCCGCPNIFGGDVPVLCVKDLKCPRLMKDLCNNYNYMILCCCSRINNYYNYNT